MPLDVRKFIPGTEWTARNVVLASIYSLIAVVCIFGYREWTKEKPKELTAEQIKQTEDFIVALTGMWVADPIQPEGWGSSLVGPTNRSLKLYPVEPKDKEPKYMISGYFVTNTELSATGDAIVTALEIFGAEGLDAADAPSIASIPRLTVVTNIAFGAVDPMFGSLQIWTIIQDKDDPNTIIVSITVGESESEVKYRRYVP